MAEIIRARWSDLQQVVSSGTDSLIVCTPFYSQQGLETVFQSRIPGSGMHFITRLSPSDWLVRVSDPNSLLNHLQQASGDGDVRLTVHQRLHAKACIANRSIGLLGSANLTSAGFGTNVELMARLTQDESHQAVRLLEVEGSTSGRELALDQLENWVEQHRNRVQQIPRGLDEEDSEVLEEMQRSLDSILGFTEGDGGGGEIILRYELDQFIGWLRDNTGSSGAETLLERHDNTRRAQLTGHVRQSYYAVMRFLVEYSDLIERLSRSLDRFGPNDVYDPTEDILQSWLDHFDRHAGDRQPEYYNYAVLRGILPPTLGGTRSGGGGASSTIKRMFPLVARFLQEQGG